MTHDVALLISSTVRSGRRVSALAVSLKQYVREQGAWTIGEYGLEHVPDVARSDVLRATSSVYARRCTVCAAIGVSIVHVWTSWDRWLVADECAFCGNTITVHAGLVGVPTHEGTYT